MTDQHSSNNVCSENQEEDDFDSRNHTEETVDPRVKVELERLNAATDLINKLEIELDEARSNFRLLLSESSHRVNNLAKKLGACVEKARPYYEARMKAKQLQSRAQKAALRYERASSSHAAAKEMVYLAEEGLKKEGRCFDPAWQEMLNHATMKVNESESERILSQHEHQQTSFAFMEAEKVVQQLHQELKRSITKSRPYFEMKAHFNQLLDEQRKNVHRLEENVLKVKMSYADALHNLEEISDEIHQKRELSDKLMESQNVSPSQPNAIWDSHYHNSYRSFSKSSSYECGMKWKSEELATEDNADITSTLSSSKLSQTLEYNESATTANVSLRRDACESSIVIKALNELTLNNEPSHLYSTSKNSCQVVNNSPECSEVQDQKFHAIDLNILRVQREDISDSESLASNDTIDTLDDNQIECLLLDQVLPTEYEKPLSHES